MGWLNRNRDFPGLWKPATPLDAQWQLHHRLWRDELPRKRSTGGRIPEVPAAQWGSQWHWWFNCVMVWMWWNVPHLKLTQPLNDIATSKKSLNCRAQLTSFSMLFSNLHCLQVINVENRGKSSTLGQCKSTLVILPTSPRQRDTQWMRGSMLHQRFTQNPGFMRFKSSVIRLLAQFRNSEVRSFLRRILVKKPFLGFQIFPDAQWCPNMLPEFSTIPLGIQTTIRKCAACAASSLMDPSWSRSLVDDSIESQEIHHIHVRVSTYPLSWFLARILLRFHVFRCIQVCWCNVYIYILQL